MDKNVLILQRFYYNFREGFFNYLTDIEFQFNLINATESRGKVKVHDDDAGKSFILKTCYFFIGKTYVVFPFLFFRLIRLRPDIIITEGGANTVNNIPVYLYCRLTKCEYIIWDLGKGFADFGNSLLRRIYMKLYLKILQHSKYIYGYNSLSRDYFCSLGFKEEKIIVLNNTIDTRAIRRIRDTYTPFIPDELKDISNNKYIFLIFVGALVKSKKVEALAELMKMLGETYFLIIVGEGTPEYRKELEDNFIGTNHIFTGYKRNDQLMPYYSLASFSVLPGLGGLSINQSMAYRVPVICKSADGAEKDLVKNDFTGYIYKDLQDAYNYIVSRTADDWKRLGKNAEDFLYENHSVEKMMDRFISYL